MKVMVFALGLLVAAGTPAFASVQSTAAPPPGQQHQHQSPPSGAAQRDSMPGMSTQGVGKCDCCGMMQQMMQMMHQMHGSMQMGDKAPKPDKR
ncbi:hypothetical protein ACFQPG_07450 [Sphingomonas sp. GCM10030256]|uniref:hypothetical protein n=1 Tax=Sphingomonas sp. GCM10030256 TaxID=3273427 RepID=UPI00361A15B7